MLQERPEPKVDRYHTKLPEEKKRKGFAQRLMAYRNMRYNSGLKLLEHLESPLTDSLFDENLLSYRWHRLEIQDVPVVSNQ